MINPFKEVRWNPDDSEKRKFALSLIIGFPCLAVVLLGLGRILSGSWGFETAGWIAGAGFALGCVLWVLPSLAKPFYVIWYFLACCIGIVVGNLILLLFFFTVIALFGSLLRWAGKLSLQKGFNPTARSYWNKAEQITNPKRYYSQF